MKKIYNNSNRQRKSLISKVKAIAKMDLENGTSPKQLQEVADKSVGEEKYEFAQGIHEAIIESYKSKFTDKEGV